MVDRSFPRSRYHASPSVPGSDKGTKTISTYQQLLTHKVDASNSAAILLAIRATELLGQ